MTEINVTKNRLIRNHVPSLKEAMTKANLGDTIKLHGRKYTISGSNVNLPVTCDLYVTSVHPKHPATILITNHQLGFLIYQGDLHLSYVNIEISAQAGGLMTNVNSDYSGRLIMDHVNIKHVGRFAPRAYFNSISVYKAGDVNYVSGAVEMKHCHIDDAQIACNHLIMQDCQIGRLDGKTSVLEAINLDINGLTASHTIIRNASTQASSVINNLKTKGLVTLQGNINVDGLEFVNGVQQSSHPLGFLGFGSKPIDVLRSYGTVTDNDRSQNGSYTMPMLFVSSLSNVINQVTLSNLTFDQNWRNLRPNNAIVSPYWLSFNNVNMTLKGHVKDGKSQVLWPTPLSAKNRTAQGSLRLINIDDRSHWMINGTDVTNGGGSNSELLEQLPLSSLGGNSNHSSKSALQQLNSKIGLKPVKAKLSQIVSTAQVAQRRKAMHQPVSPMSLHMIFEGNPGTGKTMVARLVGKALYEGGVLKSNNFKEVEGNDLIAGYMGQSSGKTKQIVSEALGGVLFIDEAYELGDTPGQNNSFKHAAVAQLIAMMENHRDELVVILAGYTYQMNRFLNTGNSGLKSRFPNIIKFPNYSSTEMVQIMQLMLNHDRVQWRDNNTGRLLVQAMGQLTTMYGANGNGRLVRNFVQEIEMYKDARINQEAQATGKSITSGAFDKELSVIDAPDVKQAYQAVINKNRATE